MKNASQTKKKFGSFGDQGTDDLKIVYEKDIDPASRDQYDIIS